MNSPFRVVPCMAEVHVWPTHRHTPITYMLDSPIRVTPSVANKRHVCMLGTHMYCFVRHTGTHSDQFEGHMACVPCMSHTCHVYIERMWLMTAHLHDPVRRAAVVQWSAQQVGNEKVEGSNLHIITTFRLAFRVQMFTYISIKVKQQKNTL